MNISYFLGANSKDGFRSLYPGFCAAPGDYLSVIKGGPGTGKSGFMRKIGAEAERRGLDAEYVLCSGDPDSLDGVYIPALRRGWVDGTAPHTADPAHFAVDGDYVNLGAFCSPLDGEHADNAMRLYGEYKAEYAAAYGYLASAAAARTAYLPPLWGAEQLAALRRRLRNILRRCRERDGAAVRGGERYLHALSCKGELWLSSEVEKLCKLVYQLDDGFGGADAALKIAAEEAEALGAELILCRSPLDSGKLDALLVPELDVGFVSAGYAVPGARHIRLDAAVDAALVQGRRAEIREWRQLEERLTALALERLVRAKALHDALEEHYKAAMDFPALTAFTERYITNVFVGRG